MADEEKRTEGRKDTKAQFYSCSVLESALEYEYALHVVDEMKHMVYCLLILQLIFPLLSEHDCVCVRSRCFVLFQFLVQNIVQFVK